MKKLSLIIATLSLLLAVPLEAPAQQPTEQPKTQLGQFQAANSAVVVRSFSVIGTLANGPQTVTGVGTVKVQSLEIFNAASGKRQYGITIDVAEIGRTIQSHRSIIDYDEIDTLVGGLDYLASVKKTSVKFEAFQADYRTKDDFRTSLFTTNNNNDVEMVIASGQIGGTSLYFKLPDLQKFKDLILKAKASIDTVRQP